MADNKPIVKLLEQDGNAFMVIALCQRAARKAGWSKEQIDSVVQDMMSSDYDHVLQVALKNFNVR